jgi:hypothetical protein
VVGFCPWQPIRCEAMNTEIQAYRFALDPTPAQEAELRSHCGGQRFAYNWGSDRDHNAARNLASLASSHSRWATINEPDGNPCQTRPGRATGIATGRPTPDGAGQRRRGNASAQDTLLHIS